MRERALYVGGRLDLGPASGGGTEVTFDVPIEVEGDRRVAPAAPTGGEPRLS
jgi:hypothetical protein